MEALNAKAWMKRRRPIRSCSLSIGRVRGKLLGVVVAAALGLGTGQTAAFGRGAGGSQARTRGEVLPEITGRGKGADPERRPEHPREAGQRRLRKRAERRYPVEILPDGTRRYRVPGFYADVAPDGAVRFHPRRASWRASQTSLSFDVGDATQRARGKDPYAAAKLRFLRATRTMRARMRRRAHRRWRQGYFARLPARLRRLWARRDLGSKKKRRLLFALWDECLEPGHSPLRRRAQQARRRILRFIQKHLPRGSPQGYTASELKALNRERPEGRPAFRPYRRLGPLPRPAGPASRSDAAPGRAAPRRAAPRRAAPRRTVPRRTASRRSAPR
jgi:hypothetical protein